MGKEQINYSCGHGGLVNLFGKHADRDRKAAWLATQLCPDCAKAAREAERAEELSAATSAAKESGLPELEGSPKQIDWAITLRGKLLGITEERWNEVAQETLVLACENGRDVEAERAEWFSARADLKKWLSSQTAAAWWIDRRNWGADRIAKEYYRSAGLVDKNEEVAELPECVKLLTGEGKVKVDRGNQCREIVLRELIDLVSVSENKSARDLVKRYGKKFIDWAAQRLNNPNTWIEADRLGAEEFFKKNLDWFLSEIEE